MTNSEPPTEQQLPPPPGAPLGPPPSPPQPVASGYPQPVASGYPQPVAPGYPQPAWSQPTTLSPQAPPVPGIGVAYQYAVSMMQVHTGVIIMAIAIWAVGNIITFFATGAIENAIIDAVSVEIDSVFGPVADLTLTEVVWITSLMTFIRMTLAALLLYPLIRVSLAIASQRRPTPPDMFDPANFARYAATSTAVAAATTLGLVLCVLPGLLVGIALAFSGYVAASSNLSPVAAMRRSTEIVQANLGTSILLLLANVGVCLLGFLACLLGLLYAVPLSILATGYMFRWCNWSESVKNPKPAAA